MPLKTKTEPSEVLRFGWAVPSGGHPLPVGLEDRTLIKIVERYQPGGCDNEFRYKVKDREGNEWDLHCSNIQARVLYTWELNGEWYPEKHPRVQAYLARELKYAEAAIEEHTKRADQLRWALERSKVF